jgi:hypothetical protein
MIGRNERRNGVGGGVGRLLLRKMTPATTIRTVNRSWRAASRPRKIAERMTGTGRFILATSIRGGQMGADLYFGLKIMGFQADYRRNGRGHPTTVVT